MFWFLQNSSARPYFKGSLKSPTLYIYHDRTIEKSDKKGSSMQFHIYPYNKDSGGLLNSLKETEVSTKERKKLLQKHELSTKG